MKSCADAPSAAAAATNPAVPAELERICLRCLAKDVAQRYSTADDLAVAYAANSGRGTRRPAAVLACVAALAAVLAAASWHFLVGKRPPDEKKPVLSGTVDARIWNTVDATRRGLSLREAAPLRPNDWLRIEVHLSRPAYVYLLWIDSQGQAAIVPMEAGRLVHPSGRRIARGSVEPAAGGRRRLAGPRSGRNRDAPALGSEEPLPVEFRFSDCLSGLPMLTAGKHQFASFDGGRLVTEETASRRGLGLGEQGRIDDAVLAMQRLIHERLRQYFR